MTRHAKHDPEARFRPLLDKRIPLGEVELGRAYVICARNGHVGVAVREAGLLGYRLHRVKFDRHYLFVEYDWEEDDRFGTAIPLERLDALPPKGEQALLDWLEQREREHPNPYPIV